MTRLVVVAALLASSPVRADPDPRIAAEASAHFEAAVALVKRGNHAAALAEFDKAYALVPRWELLYNIGVTQRTLFRYGPAIRTLERYLREGGAEIAGDRRARVEAELAELRRLVGEVVIRVDGPPARIEIDGAVEGDTPLPGPLLVAPGGHTIRALRPGELADERRIEVVSGERLELQLAPQLAPAPRPARLAIRTRPANARVRIDDGAPRPAPWIGELPAGGHRVIAELAGHRREQAELRLDPGQQRTLTLELVALPGPTPIYRRPVFWGATAAIAVAAVVGTVYLAKPDGADVVVRWP